MVDEWSLDKYTIGLFISLSKLTPEAKNNLEQYNTVQNRISVICGEEIINTLHKEKKCPTIQQIKVLSEKITEYKPAETFFLITDIGYFYIQLLVKRGSATATNFCVFNECAQLINNDDRFLHSIRNNIESLKGLKLYTETNSTFTKSKSDKKKTWRYNKHCSFLPSSSIWETTRFMKILFNTNNFQDSIINVQKKLGLKKPPHEITKDCKFLGLIECKNGMISLSSAGKKFCIMDVNRKGKYIAGKFSLVEHIRNYIYRDGLNVNCDENFKLVLDVLQKKNLHKTTVSTRHRDLRSWLLYCGLIMDRRGWVSSESRDENDNDIKIYSSGGRPPAMDIELANLAIKYIDEEKMTVTRASKLFNVSRATLYRYMRKCKPNDTIS